MGPCVHHLSSRSWPLSVQRQLGLSAQGARRPKAVYASSLMLCSAEKLVLQNYSPPAWIWCPWLVLKLCLSMGCCSLYRALAAAAVLAALSADTPGGACYLRWEINVLVRNRTLGVRSNNHCTSRT